MTTPRCWRGECRSGCYYPDGCSEASATELGVAQFFGLELFEHYEEGGALLVATSDASALRLEPGDFIVKRLWSTAVMPHIYNRAGNNAEAKP